MFSYSQLKRRFNFKEWVSLNRIKVSIHKSGPAKPEGGGGGWGRGAMAPQLFFKAKKKINCNKLKIHNITP